MIASISDEDAIMIVIDRNGSRILELAWLAAFLAEVGHERGAIIITREYLHSMSIGDEQEISMMVERQASRIVELAIGITFLLGADRELDSSITIKSIVSHLFQFNLSQTQRQRDAPSSKLLKPRDEDMKLSHTRHTRETPSKQRATKQQEATRSNR